VVFKENGFPAAEAEVTALRDGTPAGTARTDTGGEYELASLPEGSYALMARTETHMTAPEDIRSVTIETGSASHADPIHLVEGAVLEVRVVDVADNWPIPEVRVDFWAAGVGDATRTTPVKGVTDNGGTVRFPGLPSGTGRILVAKDGYATLPGETDLDVELTLGARTTKKVAMCPVYFLGGNVEDVDGNPIESARVEVVPVEGASFSTDRGRAASATQTGRDGRFRLEHLFAPEVHVQVTAEEFADFVRPKVRLPNERLRVVMRRGGAGVVAGLVVDYETGHPIRSFTADLVGQDSNASASRYEASRDAGEGTFRFTNVAPGEYRVAARAGQYLPASSRVLKVEPEGEAEWVIVRMAKTGSVEGIVVTEAEAPIEGARVEYRGPVLDFLADTGGMNLAASTGSDGWFYLERIPSGRFVLSANHSDYAPKETEVLEVSAGRTLSGVRIVLEESGRVEGHVFHADGSAAAGEVILLQRHDTGADPNLWAKTDENGFYFRGQLPPGGHYVQIKTGNRGGHPQGSRYIELEAGETEVVDFGLNGVRVYGHVTRGGTPAPGMLVLFAQPWTQSFFCATTDQDGFYEFKFLHSGSFGYKVQHPSTWRSYGQGMVSVPSGVQEYELPIELAAGSISGIVVEPGRRWLIPGALVTVRPMNVEVDLTSWVTPDEFCRTESDGSFSVSGLDLGEYSVTATAEGFGQVTNTVTLTPEACELHLVLEMKNRGSLSVEVLDAQTMTPLRGRLLLTDLHGSSVVRSESFREDPARRGTYTIDVAPGGYLLYASGDEYIGEVRRVDIEEGEESRVTVALERGCPVRITFHDREGRAVTPERVEVHDSAGPVNNVFHYGIYEWFDCILHPGPARVVAHEPGYQAAEHTFEVPPRETVGGIQQPTGVEVIFEPGAPDDWHSY
jgi:hypothetical protein